MHVKNFAHGSCLLFLLRWISGTISTTRVPLKQTQTGTQTNVIKQKYRQVPHEVYIGYIDIQINIYVGYIMIMYQWPFSTKVTPDLLQVKNHEQQGWDTQCNFMLTG